MPAYSRLFCGDCCYLVHNEIWEIMLIEKDYGLKMSDSLSENIDKVDVIYYQDAHTLPLSLSIQPILP
jgi:hypothetical protein